MSRMFPDEDIEIDWDEEAGWRGSRIYRNGKLIHEEDYSDDGEYENDEAEAETVC